MIPGMNPKQLQKMMAQMGIKSEEIGAKRVVIEREGGDIIITEPQVIAIEMQGRKSFQVTGIVEEAAFSEEDVKMVMEQTGASREKALEALKKTNDLAEAILKLKGE